MPRACASYGATVGDEQPGAEANVGRSLGYLDISAVSYRSLKEVFWYELPRTLRGLTVGVRRLYLPSGIMDQVYDTKKRVVKA